MTPNIQFVHIPKCAGTSTWKFINSIIERKFTKLKPHHSPLQDCDPDCYTFTIVRDPIERLLSFYKFVTPNKGHHICIAKPEMHNARLIDFVLHLESIRNPEISNLMTKFIAGRLSHDIAYQDALAKIKSGSFAHIGFTDDYSATQNRLLEMFTANGLPAPPEVAAYTLQQSKNIDISSQPGFQRAIEMLIDMNQHDIQLYAYLSTSRRLGLNPGLH